MRKGPWVIFLGKILGIGCLSVGNGLMEPLMKLQSSGKNLNLKSLPCSLFIMTTSVPSHLFLNVPAFFFVFSTWGKGGVVQGEEPLSVSFGLTALNSVNFNFGIELFPQEGAVSPPLPQCPDPKIKLRSRECVSGLLKCFLGYLRALGAI